MASGDPLEGFHEVNLASPTTPDVGVIDIKPQETTTSPNIIYRHLSVGSSPIQPNTLNASDLPTQPVYSSPRHLNCRDIKGISTSQTDTLSCSTSGCQTCSPKRGRKKDSNRAEREFLQGAVMDAMDGPDDILNRSTDSLYRLRSPSVLEVREKGNERLKEELAKAQRELKLKDEECERLSKVRDQLGLELEELTASLFEEAHKMVHEANVKQATAEKQLKEAQGKIDILQAEVKALKGFLSTSPTSPTKELQPGGKTPFKKGHARNKSTSSAMGAGTQDLTVMQPIVKKCRELAAAVLEAVENNTLSIEPAGLQPIRFVKASAVECGGPKKCALSGQTKSCKHRIKLGDSSNYYYISPCCRYRITSVCNFFTYIRYIHQGLVKQQDVDQMFWEIMQLRKEMSRAKLGFFKDEL
ncbi:rab-3A-interacting protein isoform X2 [Dendrobates tinctorius]|uniref:rab-3A-interacting protein isoform X2 n=1 Tax=Dendrobates tinctorius TaxID=92724 RepID=UPI003CCA1E75